MVKKNEKFVKYFSGKPEGKRPLGKHERRWDGNVNVYFKDGMDDRGSSVRFPAGAGNFSLHNRVQTGSKAHPASYAMGIRGSFPEGEAAGA
jgi:hypothetical protein